MDLMNTTPYIPSAAASKVMAGSAIVFASLHGLTCGVVTLVDAGIRDAGAAVTSTARAAKEATVTGYHSGKERFAASRFAGPRVVPQDARDIPPPPPNMATAGA